MKRTFFRLGIRVAIAFVFSSALFTTNARADGGQRTVGNADIEATVQRSGFYQLKFLRTGWKLEGTLPSAEGQPSVRRSADNIGAYHELSVLFLGGARAASIRLYDKLPLVLLKDTWTKEGSNNRPFPTFATLPKELMRFSYQRKAFGIYQFGHLGTEGPWALFDAQKNTLLISPADHFQISRMQEEDQGTAESRILPSIATLPAGFSHGTVIAFGPSINSAFDIWGNGLLALGKKRRTKNDSDLILARLGYWTDNGATYYYKYDQQLGYTGTLLAIHDEFKRFGIPLGYMQVDSWWYPKGTEHRWDARGPSLNFGEYLYRADSGIFPHELAGFHSELGLPLVTHARWIAPDSPYRSQFRTSGNVILDSAFWKSVADYLRAAGVVTYEQDWLGANAAPDLNLYDPEVFLGNMAAAMRDQQISIQYCMPLPSHYMASTQYSNVYTIRPSGDRFERNKWDWFLYGSRLATAIGLWPWADVFFSSELDNLVLSTLSGGPVGIGDALGQTDAKNLLAALRGDGILLKPDRPLLPIDAMYVADASNQHSPMVAQAESDLGSARIHYVIAYLRGNFVGELTIPAHDLGIRDTVLAYDWRWGRGEVIPAGGALGMHFRDGWSYQVVVPVTTTGLALVGETSKIVPMARQRISALKLSRFIQATIRFAESEHYVRIWGYAHSQPTVHAFSGHVRQVQYDAVTHLFAADVEPSPYRSARIQIMNVGQHPFPVSPEDSAPTRDHFATATRRPQFCSRSSHQPPHAMQ